MKYEKLELSQVNQFYFQIKKEKEEKEKVKVKEKERKEKGPSCVRQQGRATGSMCCLCGIHYLTLSVGFGFLHFIFMLWEMAWAIEGSINFGSSMSMNTAVFSISLSAIYIGMFSLASHLMKFKGPQVPPVRNRKKGSF